MSAHLVRMKNCPSFGILATSSSFHPFGSATKQTFQRGNEAELYEGAFETNSFEYKRIRISLNPFHTTVQEYLTPQKPRLYVRCADQCETVDRDSNAISPFSVSGESSAKWGRESEVAAVRSQVNYSISGDTQENSAYIY